MIYGTKFAHERTSPMVEQRGTKMNNEWTVYDGTNPPTDTSKPLIVRYMNGQERYTPLGWIDICYDWVDRVVAYFLIPPYQPEPELLPCRCGGKGDYTESSRSVHCSIPNCLYECGAPSKSEAIRMWNAAMRDDVKTSEMLNRMTAGNAAKPEPDMPETVRVWRYNIPQAPALYVYEGEPINNPFDRIEAEYIKKSKYDEAVRDAEAQIYSWRSLAQSKPQESEVCRWIWEHGAINPHWDVDCSVGTAPEKNHPSFELYTHCPYCGKPIEVNR